MLQEPDYEENMAWLNASWQPGLGEFRFPDRVSSGIDCPTDIYVNVEITIMSRTHCRMILTRLDVLVLTPGPLISGSGSTLSPRWRAEDD